MNFWQLHALPLSSTIRLMSSCVLVNVHTSPLHRTRYTCASGASCRAHERIEVLVRRRHAVLRLFVHESASEVNRSGGDVQVVSCHRYLVVFHPFVEQLTVSSIHLDSFWRRLLSSESLTSISVPSRNGFLSGTCQKVCKLCINPYISIVNPLQTDIQTYIHTNTTSD